MRIGITGSQGFLGSAVACALRESACEVTPLDSCLRAQTAALDACPKDLAWVLHFAARTSIPESFDAPFALYRNNVESALRALEIAFRAGAAFLFMSSYVYGVPQYNPVDERHPLAAENPYMASKIAGETASGHLSRLLGIPLVILRGFHIYGPRGARGRLIPDLLECVHRGEPLAVNDPDAVRDYVYVRDFGDLVLRIVSTRPPKTGVFNVGSGVGYSNREVADTVRRLAGDVRPIVNRSRPRPHDVAECRADITAVKEAFGWTPRYSLEAGLAEILSGEMEPLEKADGHQT
jgi:nucleoside-diphosphate-sugar epimerase